MARATQGEAPPIDLAPPRPSPAAQAADAPIAVRADTVLISSEALFAGASEVQIEHRGALYRLKRTSLGKLILTK